MSIIIVFSSPNHEEYKQVWAPLIDREDGYIRVNDIGDKIYPFNGKILCTDAEWNTGKLVREIGTIEKDNNSSECVVMLHDDKIPDEIKDNFKNIRFVPYGSGKGTFYKDHIIPFVTGDIKECFDNLWKALQVDETKEENLTALFLACKAFPILRCNSGNMWAAAFGKGFDQSFENTDVYNELMAKRSKQSENKYENIMSLFNHIKSNSVDEAIITAATASLSEILSETK